MHLCANQEFRYAAWKWEMSLNLTHLSDTLSWWRRRFPSLLAKELCRKTYVFTFQILPQHNFCFEIQGRRDAWSTACLTLCPPPPPGRKAQGCSPTTCLYEDAPFCHFQNVTKSIWFWLYDRTIDIQLWLMVHTKMTVKYSCQVIGPVWHSPCPGIILCVRSANERHYIAMPSVIGWVHTQNAPCLPAPGHLYWQEEYCHPQK